MKIAGKIVAHGIGVPDSYKPYWVGFEGGYNSMNILKPLRMKIEEILDEHPNVDHIIEFEVTIKRRGKIPLFDPEVNVVGKI